MGKVYITRLSAFYWSWSSDRGTAVAVSLNSACVALLDGTKLTLFIYTLLPFFLSVHFFHNLVSTRFHWAVIIIIVSHAGYRPSKFSGVKLNSWNKWLINFPWTCFKRKRHYRRLFQRDQFLCVASTERYLAFFWSHFLLSLQQTIYSS